MIQVPCPYCGKRNLTEFRYGGQAYIARPETPAQSSEQEWGEYLFFRDNIKGVMDERWYHSAGCRRWFLARRNTVTDQFLAAAKYGETL